MMRFTVLFCCLFVVCNVARAQLYSTQYRVPGQEWKELNTERFRIIYPERYRHEAIRSLHILEREYDDIQALTGGKIRRFPFIINPENDRSNGFVAPLNFRSEIELSPIIGKTMNPASGNWLEMVLPHELVHVMHFNVNPRSFSRLAGILSPDVRRSIHSAAPMGVFEGLAVQHESHNHIPFSGRGNYPYFTNQFQAVLHTSEEWSMGQLLTRSDYSLPFDRHYIGGYEFSNWMLAEYGPESIKQAIHFHYKYPFLGYGTALRATTGKWPRALYREFSEDKKEEERQRLGSFENVSGTSARELDISGTCRRISRPKWISNTEIVYYGRFCNKSSGFYLYDIQNETEKLLKSVSITPEFAYSLAPGSRQIIYSRYHTDPLYNNLFQGDLHKFNMDTGNNIRLTKNARLYGPHLSSDKIFSIHPEGSRMRLAFAYTNNLPETHLIQQVKESSVIDIAIHPTDNNIAAIIGKVKSVQGIWFEDLSEDITLFNRLPDIVFEHAAVFDVQWHADGTSILFSSGRDGAINLYKYDTEQQQVVQLTNSPFNIMEVDYSPDHTKIVYVKQIKNEQLLYVQNHDDMDEFSLSNTLWQAGTSTENRMNRPLMNQPETDIEFTEKNYRTGPGWLKPRFWAPGFANVSGRREYSLNTESVDVMSRHAYSAGFQYYAGRPWFDFTFDYKTFFPGFRAEFFNQPSFTNFRVENDEGEERNQILLQQSRGGSLKIPVQIRLESNVRFSSLLFEPQYFLTQVRFFDEEATRQAASEFGTRHTAGFRTVANIGLRQFSRDVQPNSGLVLHAEGRLGLNSDRISIDTGETAITGNLSRRRGIRAGAIGYIAPLSKWNQSLRVSGEIFSQTASPVFGVLSRFSELFEDYPILGANNIGIVNTRYVIPLVYPDQGGLLVPFYLSNIYLVLLSQTAVNLDQPGRPEHSRSVFGAGIRSRFKFGNLAFDIGISVGWEPARNNVTYYFGSF